MKRWVELCTRGARTALGWVLSFGVWALWLALALLLVFQLYIATANELAIPDFALRQIETRLANSGLRATFGRTSFDPTGRVLIENVQISLPAYSEPIARARAVFVQVNPWMLAVGQLEPTEIRISDASLTVPALLSPTGRPEEIVRQVEALLEPHRNAIALRQLNGRAAGVVVSILGTVPLAPRRDEPALDAFARMLTERLPAFCRHAVAAAEHLAAIDDPAVYVELAPSESRALSIQLRALARAVRIEDPVTARATNVELSTRLLLMGEAPATHIDVVAEEIVSEQVAARGVHARIAGRLRPGGMQFEWRDASISADSVAAAGVTAEALAGVVFPRPLPQLEATFVGNIVDSPLAARATVDLRARTAGVGFEGAVSPAILDVLSQRFRRDVRKYYDFESLVVDRGEAQFGAGWKFERLRAQVRVPRMRSYGVIMEDGKAVVEFEPGRFFSPEAFARVGDSHARGSYEHDFKTQEYRFLLDGRLRPMAIAGWFRDWWPNFFRQFEFPATPPEASVDVRGVWREGWRSAVFVFADVAKPAWRGTALERVRTRLFIRPGFFDGLELLARHQVGNAYGRFTYTVDTSSQKWRSLDLALSSTLGLDVIRQLLGPASDVLAPFELAAPPALELHGTFAGPAAPAEERDRLRITARTVGEFRFHHFPLQDTSFVATLDGSDIVIDNVETMFGGGVAAGRARVSGTGAARRLGFDYALRDASLGQVAAALSEFFAAQKGRAPAPPGKFVQEKANVRLDFAASAEGNYADPFSFKGEGNASLRGGGLGQVPLLGALSELLKFTALRFNEARGNFKIDGAHLVFPEVIVRGSNSAIDAHGVYHLDRRELDFNAKIFPFQESENLIKSVVGVVLTPLSNALEVKLTGTIDKPEWALTLGPTNILRALAPGESGASKPESPAPAEPNPAAMPPPERP